METLTSCTSSLVSPHGATPNYLEMCGEEANTFVLCSILKVMYYTTSILVSRDTMLCALDHSDPLTFLGRSKSRKGGGCVMV